MVNDRLKRKENKNMSVKTSKTKIKTDKYENMYICATNNQGKISKKNLQLGV
jgi:hypothetical protein